MMNNDKKAKRLISVLSAAVLSVCMCAPFVGCDKKPIDEPPKLPVDSVEEYYVERIEVATDDTFKTSYADGEPFDTTGMTVKAFWNDGYTEENVSSSKYYVVPGIITTGVTEVTVHYGDASTKVSITAYVRELEGIDMLSPPSTVLYVAGDTFNPAGLILRYKYTDGSYEAIDDYDIADVTFPTDPLVAGQKKITVTYGDYTLDVPITVKASARVLEMENATLVGSKIRKKSQANSDGTPHWMQEFASGGDFVADVNSGDVIALSFKLNKATKAALHLQGASNYVNVNPPTVCRELVLNEIMNVYVNGTELVLGDDIVFPGKTSSTADKWLWVQWAIAELGEIDLVEGSNSVRFVFKNPNGYKQPYEQANPFGDAVGQYDSVMLEFDDADVKLTEITEIEASVPTRTEYVSGEAFDKSSVTVTATYADGTKSTVDDYEAFGSVTSDKIKIGCGGFTLEVEGLVVTPRVLTSLELTHGPDKTEYEAGERFDPTGMIVTAVYNDGRVKDVVTDYAYPTDVLYAGVDSARISYGGKYIDIPIAVSGSATKIIKLEAEFAKAYTEGADVSEIHRDDISIYSIKGDGSREKLASGYTVTLPQSGKIELGKTSISIKYDADGSLDTVVPVRVARKIEIMPGSGVGCIGEDGGNQKIIDATDPSGGAYVKNVNGKTLKITFDAEMSGVGNVILRGSSTYVLAANQGEIGEMFAKDCMTVLVNGTEIDIADGIKFIGKSKEDCADKGVVNLGNWCDLVFENILFRAGTNTVEFRFKAPPYENNGGGSPAPYLDTVTVDFGA